MRKTVALLAIMLFAREALTEEVAAACIAPGCVITLLQRAQFIEDRETCEWEYIPGKSSRGRTLLRGRTQEFVVVGIEMRDGEEIILASQYVLFDLKETAATFRFAKIYLTNQRAFSITHKTPA